MRVILPLLVLLICFTSCKKDDNTIVYGYEYFPIDSGKYVIYDVVDILHDDVSGVHDTDHYQIMEVMGEVDTDLEGEDFTKMYRYKREADTLSWLLKDAWVVKKTNRSVEVVEENNRVIRMAFSISYDQYWDCNALNSNNEAQCYYRDIYEASTIGGIDYDSTVVVEINNFESFIEQQRAYDVYAKDIGRVKSVFKDIEIYNGDTLDVNKGTELFYTAVSWGG